MSDAEDIPENLRELYEYIKTGKVGGNLTRRIAQAVERARRNEVWRSEYMKELLHDEDVREEGRAEGRAEGMNLRSLEIAKKMLAKGMDEATVMDVTGLTAEEMKLLKAKV